MSESFRQLARSAITIGGNRLPPDTIYCAIARLIWPDKTAANWAAASGVKERMAKYWLAGSHPVSATGRLAIVRRIV